MKTAFFLFALATTFSCTAQNVPVEVKNAFTKSFPNVTVKKWDKEGSDYEANFTKDGKTMSATFDAKGNWKETETDIKISELPATIIEYVKTKYNNATIKEAAIISNTEKKKMYEAEVKGKDLLFDENGKYLREEAD